MFVLHPADNCTILGAFLKHIMKQKQKTTSKRDSQVFDNVFEAFQKETQPGQKTFLSNCWN